MISHEEVDGAGKFVPVICQLSKWYSSVCIDILLQ